MLTSPGTLCLEENLNCCYRNSQQCVQISFSSNDLIMSEAICRKRGVNLDATHDGDISFKSLNTSCVVKKTCPLMSVQKTPQFPVLNRKLKQETQLFCSFK